VRVNLLGPLQLFVAGEEVDVPGRRRRAVLALLALSSGHVVSAEGLVDAIWPEDPPQTGRQALHSHISRLRRHLGPAGARLRRVGPGYALDLDEGEFDVARMRSASRAVSEQLGRDPRSAAHLADEALSLWRGVALEEFAGYRSLEAEAVGLDEVFLRLRDDLMEARLVGELAPVTHAAAAAALEQPLRERTSTLLMR